MKRETGTLIFLEFGTVRVPAVLTDTVAARDFRRRLPLTVSGTRVGGGYSFPAAIGCFDPEETQTGWQNGDLSVSGGWLRVLLDGRESSPGFPGTMVVARIAEADLTLLNPLPRTVRLRIELAAGGADGGNL